MEPISGIASVLTIVGTADGIFKIHQNVKKFLKAPETMDALIGEIEVLQTLVQDLRKAQYILEQLNERPAFLTQIGRAEKKLAEIHEFVMEQFMHTLRDADGEIRPIRVRLRWIQKQSQLRALHSDLATINSRLLNCVTVMVLWHQTQTQVSLQGIKLAVTRGLSHHYMMQSELSDDKDDTSTTESLTEASKTAIQPIDSMQSSASLEHGAKWPAQSADLTAVGCCNQECQCTCHFSQQKQTARASSLIFGTVHLTYNKGDSIGACNAFGCKSRLPVSLSVGYYFPRWLLNRAIHVSIDNSLAGSFRMVLQVPRICSDASTIFHLATAGDIRGMKMLFDRRLASPHDVSSSFGYSVLHHAADLEHVDAIRFLIECGSSPHFSNHLNLTPIDLIWNRILGRRTEASKRRELINLFGSSQLASQIESRGLTKLQQIVLGLIDRDIGQMVKDASLEDINAKDLDGNTVLSWAARCGNEYATRCLLSYGADPLPASRFGSTALHYAAAARSSECLKLILEAGVKADTRNTCLLETPLHVAALRHDNPEEYLEPLIARGADLNLRDHEGSSVLAFAVQANHVRSTLFLLEHGADIDAADEGGMTPTGLAIIYKHYEILALLLEHGPNTAQTTDTGATLLHLCAQHGDPKTVFILQQAKLETPGDALDLQGMRPIDHAHLHEDEIFKSAFQGLVASLVSQY